MLSAYYSIVGVGVQIFLVNSAQLFGFDLKWFIGKSQSNIENIFLSATKTFDH